MRGKLGRNCFFFFQTRFRSFFLFFFTKSPKRLYALKKSRLTDYSGFFLLNSFSHLGWYRWKRQIFLSFILFFYPFIRIFLCQSNPFYEDFFLFKWYHNEPKAYMLREKSFWSHFSFRSLKVSKERFRAQRHIHTLAYTKKRCLERWNFSYLVLI